MKRLFLLALVFFSSAAWAVDPLPAIKEKTFVYKKTPHGELTLVVNYPPGWKAGDQRAALVYFFSGAWRWGDTSQLEPQARYLASLGMVAIRADYRVSSRFGEDVTPLEGTEDGRSAMRWVRANAGTLGIDPDRIVGAGGSAGGQIIMCALACPEVNAKSDDLSVSPKPNAIILFSPVLRFNWQPWIDQFDDRKDKIPLIEPMGRVQEYMASHTMPPLLMLFGQLDPLTLQGKELLPKLRACTTQVEMLSFYMRDHHFFARNPAQGPALAAVTQFLARHGYLSEANNALFAPRLINTAQER